MSQHRVMQVSPCCVPACCLVAVLTACAVLSARLGCGKGGLSWASEEMLGESLQVSWQLTT